MRDTVDGSMIRRGVRQLWVEHGVEIDLWQMEMVKKPIEVLSEMRNCLEDGEFE